ncbi:MAG: thiamine phosphate synthase [Candidatus Altiarchaeota archaeon]
MNLRGLYFITDRKLSKKSVESTVEDAVKGGVKVVQYREKELPAGEMLRVAENLRDITREAGVLFLVNDRVDIALAVGADGVHLGQDDMPIEIARRLLGRESVIGVTVHNVREARDAERRGADYLGMSPVFSTSTKSDAGEPAGVELIREVKKVVAVPCVAIGGIIMENLQEVIDAGADSVAMISAILSQEDISEAVRKVNQRFGL